MRGKRRQAAKPPSRQAAIDLPTVIFSTRSVCKETQNTNMPKKTWRAKHGPLEILFENHWSFSGTSRERLIVNEAVRSERTTEAFGELRDSVAGSHEVVLEAEGERFVVWTKVGSKWPGLFMGCHIFVNGLLVGGDTRSKLMFTETNESGQ